MPRPLRHKPRINFRKTHQITGSHCGPAVLQMLLSHLGLSVTQPQLTRAAGATRTIKTHGIRLDHMVKAITVLKLPVSLWSKQPATIENIQQLLDTYHYPVGVEWQGMFYEDLDEEDTDEDYGHYSVVTDVDFDTDLITLVDPYRRFTPQDHEVDINQFYLRWWDNNQVKDPRTGKTGYVLDQRLLFVVTPPAFKFPRSLKLTRHT